MKRKLTGADKRYQEEVKLGIAEFKLTRPRNPTARNAVRHDRLTVNGVDYDLSPAMADGLFSCYQNLKKKVGRPKGGRTVFSGITEFCLANGYSHQHVRLVLTGYRRSARVRRLWAAWNGRSAAV